MAVLSKEEIQYLRDVVSRELERARGGHVIGEWAREVAALEKTEHFLEGLLGKLGGTPAEGHARPARPGKAKHS
jgi:hypothetical protein